MMLYQVCRECPKYTPNAAMLPDDLCRAHREITRLTADLAQRTEERDRLAADSPEFDEPLGKPATLGELAESFRERVSHAEFSRFVQEARQMREERDEARAALAEMREAINPLMPYLIEMGHPDEPEYPDRAIVMRGPHQWILAGDIRRLRTALAARPSEAGDRGE
jgi:hypothetical protein